MPNSRIITACLVAFTPVNGFVNITVLDNVNSEESIVTANHYFRNTSDISKAHVNISQEDDPETHTTFLVLYDNKLHGTKECPYLVMQKGEKGRIEGVERKDYIGIIKAVDHIKQTIAATNQPSSSDHDHAQQSGETSAEMSEVA